MMDSPRSAPAAPERELPAGRGAYRRFLPMTTRWLDNDAYGHLNNIVYYGLFDTAVNALLIAEAGLDIEHGGVIGLVVESHCNYFAPLAFPQRLEAGVTVARAGRSSVRYDIGIFAAGDAQTAARGHLVHVYVDRQSRRPVPLPPGVLDLATALR